MAINKKETCMREMKDLDDSEIEISKKIKDDQEQYWVCINDHEPQYTYMVFDKKMALEFIANLLDVILE